MSNPSDSVGFVPPDPDELASLLPGYEIHHLIAAGGMGAVYRAVQKSLDRTVALKILPREFSADAEYCAGFEAEAKAMARLNHPNLIGVYDFGEVAGMLYIAMEFVPGKSIYHSAHDTAIDPGEVIRLVSAICRGLAHAHENGILHRDIKPSNILLTLNAEPKIGDFGLARPIERKTAAGETIFGTPGYTAPEVVEAPETVDHRADLFSIGVLLHELLTGKLPSHDPRPASVQAGCDTRFDAIIRQATLPLPAGRHSCAEEIARELQRIATAPAVHAPRAGLAIPPVHVPVSHMPAVSHPQKSSGPLAAMALVVVALLGIAGFAWVSKKAPPESVAATATVASVTQPEPDPSPQARDSKPITEPPPLSAAPPEAGLAAKEPDLAAQGASTIPAIPEVPLTTLEYAIFIKKDPEAWVSGKDGSVAGIAEDPRVPDAFKVRGMPRDAEFRIHVANRGWRNWKPCEGNLATGNSEKLEAIQFRSLAGLPAGKRLYGRAYLAGLGWQKTMLVDDIVVLGGTNLETSINALQLAYGDGGSATNAELVKQADARFNALLPPGSAAVSPQISVANPGYLGLGRWLWSNSGLEFTLLPGGDVSHPKQSASWTCADLTASIRTYQIAWDNGYTDTMTISWDGAVMSGQNQQGKRLAAARVDGGAQFRSVPGDSAAKSEPEDPSAGYRMWTKEGNKRPIEAVIVGKSADDSSVDLMMRNGKVYPVPTAVLVAEDRELVKKWRKTTSTPVPPSVKAGN